MHADEGRWTQINPPIDADFRRFALPLRPLGEGGTRGMRAGARKLRMRNCELRAGDRGDFGAEVRGTPMDADGSTDWHRFSLILC